MDRRQHLRLLATASMTVTGLTLAACSPTGSPSAPSTSTGTAGTALPLGPAADGATPLAAETAELEELYRQAVAAGGKLTVWAGGDAPNQQDALKQQLQRRFPELDITINVQLSKDHDVAIDAQLADGTLTPDVAMLQTSHDFERWKDEGHLIAFKPIGVAQQRAGYADPDGRFLTSNIFSFLPQYSKKGVPGVPDSYEDFLAPPYKGHLVLTPPHDDDAVLYVYDKLIQKYGDDFLDRLAAQDPRFVRGTAAPAAMVGTEGLLGNLTGYATAPEQPSQSFIPAEDWFITWTQRAAVFEKAPNPAAGKLFLAYMASKEFQSTYGSWTTRKDVAAPEGLKELSDYPNTDPMDFVAWMRDRDHVDELKARMTEVFGAVTGESPLTDPELLKIVGAS